MLGLTFGCLDGLSDAWVKCQMLGLAVILCKYDAIVIDSGGTSPSLEAHPTGRPFGTSWPPGALGLDQIGQTGKRFAGSRSIRPTSLGLPSKPGLLGPVGPWPWGPRDPWAARGLGAPGPSPAGSGPCRALSPRAAQGSPLGRWRFPRIPKKALEAKKAAKIDPPKLTFSCSFWGLCFGPPFGTPFRRVSWTPRPTKSQISFETSFKNAASTKSRPRA